MRKKNKWRCKRQMKATSDGWMIRRYFSVNRLGCTQMIISFMRIKKNYKKQNQRLKQSLNGIWKFHYSVNALNVRLIFIRNGFN